MKPVPLVTVSVRSLLVKIPPSLIVVVTLPDVDKPFHADVPQP